ncbi:MAG: aminodeoxychorismate synthase component I, partial [Amphritea sp.]|nr:aminodeoxychorismate synthase component I [Amphritea sp.]
MYRQLSLPYLEYSQDYFSRIRHLPYPVFLDSGKPASRYGRYDIISAAPQAILISRADQTTLIRDNEQQTLESLPFNALKALYAEASLSCPQPDDETIAALPFCGGMLGYFSYDLGRTIEQMPEFSQNDMT